MAVEFGEEYEAGADYEFGVDVDAGAEDYAAGAEAVDAALGAVRRRRALRGYVPAGAKKVRGMFTYFVQLPTPAATYIGGAGGTAQATCNTPYQVIDIQAAESAANAFNFTSIFIGDTNMILGAGQVPVATFAAAVQNRFVRFTTLQRGQTMQCGFLNVTALTTPRTLTIIAKVRSYRRA